MTRKKVDEGNSWLSMLKMELSLIDDEHLIEPDWDDEDEKAQVLGEASLEVKRLWTYFCNLEENSTRTFIEAKYTRNSIDKREQLLKKASEMKAKAEMARQIVFLSIRDQHGIWNPHLGVGLRKGWKVVSFRSDDNPLIDLLKGML